MPTTQARRNQIASMKLIPVKEMIEGRRLLLIDDSIVRGTQLGNTSRFLYESGAKEVHVRPACPPDSLRLHLPELLPFHFGYGSDYSAA